MTDTARAHLIHAFRKVLRPLVKILIRAGVRYDEFVEVIKGVFVESAIRDGIGRAGPLTRARVTLVTGVARRDVDRYVDNESLLAPPPPTHAATLIEILHLWNTDKSYLGPYGVPLEIDFDKTRGRSFVDLVHRVDAKADAGFLLEELLRSGVVAMSGESFLKVISRSYVTGEMSPQVVEYLGNTLASLAHTLEYNTSPDSESKRLQRSVFADRGLQLDALPAFEQYAKERVQQMLSDIDDWLGQHSRVDGELLAVETGVSVFHYVENQEEEPALKALLPNEA